MSNRLYQAILAIVAGLSANIIGWPGPHGGLQFVYEILWRTGLNHNQTPQVIKAVLATLVALGVIVAFIPQRRLRLAGTSISVTGMMVLFLLLLTRIYPPAIPVVLATACPFLAAVVGSILLARREGAGKGDTHNRH